MLGTPELDTLLSAAARGGPRSCSSAASPVKARGGMFEQLCTELPWSQQLSGEWRERFIGPSTAHATAERTAAVHLPDLVAEALARNETRRAVRAGRVERTRRESRGLAGGIRANGCRGCPVGRGLARRGRTRALTARTPDCVISYATRRVAQMDSHTRRPYSSSAGAGGRACLSRSAAQRADLQGIRSRLGPYNDSPDRRVHAVSGARL